MYNYAFTCLNFAFKALKRIAINIAIIARRYVFRMQKSTKHNLYV